MKLQRDTILLILLSIFYIVGLVGISAPESRQAYLHLSSFNLLLTLVLFTLTQSTINSQTFILFLYISLTGFFIEVLGVQTGLIFGSYHYGESLGMQWLNVPLIIGVNWYVFVMATYGITQDIKVSRWLRAALSAMLATSIDAIMEPLAQPLDFWHWEGGEIPLQNFVAWFVISYLMQLIVQQFKITVNKKAAVFVLGLQLIFFVCLHFTIG
jgi:putative membrane protein